MGERWCSIVGSDEGVRAWSLGNASGAFLTGFDPSSAELKLHHREWLGGFAARLPALAGDLFVVGLMPPSEGKEGRGLAERRARAVYRHLRRGTRSFPWVHVHVGTKGKGLAGSPAEAPARDGGVAVVHVAPGWIPRWLRGSLQPRPLPGNIFYVRLAGFGAVRSRLSGDARTDSAPFALRLEIGDGRWSVLYRAFGESAQAGIPGRDAELPPRRAVGPWHTFQSPFELTVAGFDRSRAELSRDRWRPESLKLQIARPSTTIHPFLTGPDMPAAGLAEVLVGADPEGSLPTATRRPLDRRERPPFEHEIPGSIRAHLRRGGAPGMPSLESLSP